MFNICNAYKIFVCKEPVDMRNGFEGLSAEVIKIFDKPIISGGFFVFFNKKKNLLKVLYWDVDGPAIWYKRLEKGKFLYKKTTNEIIDRKEFVMLLEGITPKHINRRFKL